MKRLRGLSLIEILAGLVIGIFIALMATTSLNIFQASSRTANSGNNATIDGINALYNLERDIKVAGLGLFINQTISCISMRASYNGNVIANPAAVAPITINSPGGSTPDSITVFYGNSVMAGAPIAISNQVGNTLNFSYLSTTSIQNDDYALVETTNSVSPCTLIKVTNVTNTSLTYDAGGLAVDVTPPNTFLVLLKTPSWLTWRILNNSLVVTDNLAATNSIVADNIVQLVTQYGVTNGISNSIAQWVYPSDPSGEWSNPDQAHQQRIRAIRLAIVARSAQKERPTGGGTNCNTTTVGPTPWPGATPVDLSADPNWQCYRYRTFQTVIPVKNLIEGLIG